MNLRYSVLMLAMVAAFASCKKEEDGSPSTSKSQVDNTPQFSADFETQKKPFVGIITRHTCGACGQFGHPTFDSQLENQENINGASFHYNLADPLHTKESIDVFDHYPVIGTPTFFLNAQGFGTQITSWENQSTQQTTEMAEAQIAMSGMQNENTFSLNVKTVLSTNLENTPTALALYTIESNIVSPQFDYSRNPNLVEDYIHNHVFRSAANGKVFGDPIAYTTDTISTNYQVSVGDSVNTDNVYFVAVLWEIDNNQQPVDVINSQSVRR